MKRNKSIIDKLTALWALNESGLGGFLHVFNSPFTGLIVGGVSILLISLIAFYAENKWQSILKALIIVLIIKMAVSPYSPFGAYVAVSFQALVGALLLSNFSWKGLTLLVLGIVTFLESALQKLLILTIVYGTNLWDAINIYGAWVQKKLDFVSETSTTTFLVTLYLVVYGVAGLLAGLFIKSIIKIIANKPEEEFYLKSKPLEDSDRKKKVPFRTKVIWVWLGTVAVMVLAFSLFGGTLFGWQKATYIVLRSFLILMLWYLVIGPFLLKLIRKYLQKKESKYEEDISNAMDLFPYFRQIIAFTWKETKHLKGYTRFKYFMANSISNCIHFKMSSK
ncbi:hypothetical protein DFQ11_101247 [Winogradskyella epiphytica]|uniref:Uncharacterized protein n=1 Tax=Winogradskyella epiphytica TaxID=262005 RepID=A0A2V4WZH1_9FLAO|nr:hypothetical protein [Winogradskyella epiphytica]PYE82818.1 hypothetical protein DFQ11_101247 [Winogradskyella epiphytica]GGW53861.1 hypothetical protein GCM10008085_01200 [Winogradskyella epiphytica]